MSNPRDLDTLARSLSGDWQSRIDLFKRFIWDNSRIRRLAGRTQNMDDFLHDCLTNVLATGHSFDETQSIASWVEWVASWTALERQRTRLNDAPDGSNRIRLCAGIEGDEPDNRKRLDSYVPPRGSGDTLVSRLSAIVGDPQFMLLSMRASQNNTWEDISVAAGKPLNTIGPPLVRAVDRLSRFFGAPPPLNPDLEPVFAWVIREEATRRHSDPSEPRGRIAPMQLDPVFYAVTPEMRKIGLTVPTEVRTIALWDAARASTPPGPALRDHLAKCHYCADLLRALLLMQRALESGRDADFLLCPGGFTLLKLADNAYEPFDRHLAECEDCREERSRGGIDQEEVADSGLAAGKPANAVRYRLLAWIAAAVLVLLGGGYFLVHRTTAPENQPSKLTLNDTPAPIVKVDPRYSDLAQVINVTDARWFASVLPQNREYFNFMIEELQTGHPADASLLASGLGEKDPAAQMLYSYIQYRQNSISEGYRAMLRSEAMSPRNSFRCWAALQCAVIVGDMKVVDREVEHLSNDPEYAAKAKALLARIKARG